MYRNDLNIYREVLQGFWSWMLSTTNQQMRKMYDYFIRMDYITQEFFFKGNFHFFKI